MKNEEINNLKENIDYLGIYVSQVEIKGKATMKNTSFSGPIIFHKFENTDHTLIANSVEKLCQILFGSGATKLILPYGDGVILKSMHDLRVFLKSFKSQLMHFHCAHMMNSCPIGSDNAVLNKDGSLINNSNIFVLDASTVPTTSDSSPQLAIMSLVKFIIEKNSSRFN